MRPRTALPPLALLLATAAVLACNAAPVGPLPEASAGTCRYTNPFSDGRECRDYLGPWDEAAAAADCDAQRGDFTAGDAVVVDGCAIEDAVGACVLNAQSDTPIRVSFREGTCNENKRGCEIFAGGAFLVVGACDPDGGSAADDPDVLTDPFPEPELSCVEPLPGDAPGAGEGGAVCQWITMQGCTEEGRDWLDYGSCELPRKQRPYYPVPTADDAEREDERLQDPTYVAELDWVKQQLSSCSCVCCHSTSAPEGPANWYLEQPGNFVNGMFDMGIAEGAGVVESSLLGDYDPDDNNGFTRMPSIFPSTDPARMQAFFMNEFQHRGLQVEDFPPAAYFGPITEQDDYAIEPCEEGDGVGADGTISWRDGGGARIVYVLEDGARNPGVPPDRDTPAGTLWRIDAVDPRTALIEPGVRYGAVPDVAAQRVPAGGAAPPALTSGARYTLYVDADYLQPIARCSFLAP